MALFESMADDSDEGCGTVFASFARFAEMEGLVHPFHGGNQALAYHLARQQHLVRL